jgi:hypothetical protein
VPKGHACLAYAADYLIETDHGVIVDVYRELAAMRIRLERLNGFPSAPTRTQITLEPIRRTLVDASKNGKDGVDRPTRGVEGASDHAPKRA